MRNLAGVETADKVIRNELWRARVPAVEGERSKSEVPYSVTGKIGPFTFRRAWYYWVVEGPVPLDVAEDLYEDSVGRTDIRAGGNAACVAPEMEATWRTPDGKEVVTPEEWEELCQLRDRHNIEIGQYLPSSAPADLAEHVVEIYHIDSEVGLRVFVDEIHELVGVEA